MDIGDVKIKTQDGDEMVLQDVRYVPQAYNKRVKQ
jgi:hypothetical protein